MGLQGVYVDKTGTTHTEAYAKVVELAANWLEERARVVMLVFHSEEARNSNKYPIDSHTYVLGTEAFGKVPVFDENGNMVKDPLSMTPLMEPVLDENGEPVFDEDGNPVMQEVLDENGDVVLDPESGTYLLVNGPTFSDVFGTDILDLESMNPVSQGYGLIKLLPEWRGWIDV